MSKRIDFPLQLDRLKALLSAQTAQQKWLFTLTRDRTHFGSQTEKRRETCLAALRSVQNSERLLSSIRSSFT